MLHRNCARRLGECQNDGCCAGTGPPAALGVTDAGTHFTELPSALRCGILSGCSVPTSCSTYSKTSARTEEQRTEARRVRRSLRPRDVLGPKPVVNRLLVERDHDYGRRTYRFAVVLGAIMFVAGVVLFIAG